MGATSKKDVERYRDNLRDEVDGEALYLALARQERDENLKEVFTRLAESERRHQSLWRTRLAEAGEPVPDFRPSLRVRILGRLARVFGTGAIVPVVTRMEDAAQSMYDSQPEAVAAGLPADERSHARLFREIGKTRAGATGVPIARLEGRHRGASANALRAAVLGANDGLVSNLSLVMGVVGADPGRSVVLLGGLAGLLAGALSMALGEWVSVRSAAEAFARQLQTEAQELEAFPEEEEEELTLIYRAKGLSPDDARATARRILSRKDTALETLAREELGMSEGEAGSPWTAAVASFFTFATGAVLPVLPWAVAGGFGAIVATVVMAGGGLFVVGASTSLFTGRSFAFSGARMLVLGLAAAAITFGIGRVVGVDLEG